jgi:hypothetical protein
MPVCPRCHKEYAAPEERCLRCEVPLLGIVPGRFDLESPLAVDADAFDEPTRESELATDDHEEEGDDDPLQLLLEEPIPEIAEMVGEFLKDCGIRVVITPDTIGRLYRLPVPLSQTRLYVRASEFAEARDLIQRFTRSN